MWFQLALVMSKWFLVGSRVNLLVSGLILGCVVVIVDFGWSIGVSTFVLGVFFCYILVFSGSRSWGSFSLCRVVLACF